MADTAPPPIPQPDGFTVRPVRPLSASAVTAFVFSLLICLPVVNGVIGLAMGIIGLVDTGDGRKRGRAFAIAAIPVSLLTGGGAAALLVWAYTLLQVVLAPMAQFVAAAERFDGDLTQVTNGLYGAFSPSLQRNVSQETLSAWLGDINLKYGKIRGISHDPNEPISQSAPEHITLTLQATFEQATVPAAVTVSVGRDQGIVDIRIDGRSLTGS